FNHIFASYYDDGGSVYEEAQRAPAALTDERPAEMGTAPEGELDIATVSQETLERITSNPQFATLVAEQLRGEKAFFAVPSKELVAADESHEVEFKATARWNLREGRKDKRMEDAIVKTIAGLLNTDGGTLFIGVADDGTVVGLDRDLELVKPPNADGLINWLTTHLVNAMSHTPVMRTRARIDFVEEAAVCRVDVARSSTPVIARMSDAREAFWVRMNNSTRELPEIEIESYRRDHWRD
ncbi:MAG: ATP-binding protein, partial [Solirubrobacterales bacterium]|nr:ATP-binding protein [Solirubrobacterales bacterium]